MSSLLKGAKLIRGIEQAMILPAKTADAKILDFGCGDGSLVDALRRMKRSVLGYDPIAPIRDGFTRDFDYVQQQGPFDLIAIFDVIDHVKLPVLVDIFKEATSVLRDGGRIFLRAHPFSSIDGTHSYSPINLAYVHLCLTEQEARRQGLNQWSGLKVVKPLSFYDELFKRLGLRILVRKVHNTFNSKIINGEMIARIRSLNYDGGIADQDILKNLSVHFIDYVLAPA